MHLSRDGRLLSVQNFTMGNHEVDTGSLPYGIYDVEVEVVVNGKVVDKRMQRVNKLFSPNRGANAAGLAILGRDAAHGRLARRTGTPPPGKGLLFAWRFGYRQSANA